MNGLLKGLLAGLIFIASVAAHAQTGPIIIGGDDLDDHGERLGGVNVDGWAYAQSAVTSLLAQESRPGIITHDIVAIGTNETAPGSYLADCSSGMVDSVTNILGLTVLYVDSTLSATPIADLFSDIATGTVNPRLLWIVSDTSSCNDLSDEQAELAGFGAQINAFQQQGGGLLSHHHDFDWLSVLLPGIIINTTCRASAAPDPGAYLTPQGMSAFPGLTDAQVDAGACHNVFQGPLGGLDVLARDGFDQPLIIGGGAGVGFVAAPMAIPFLPLWGLVIMMTLLGVTGIIRSRTSSS